MTIWVNEQIDPSGIIYACIACQNRVTAEDCYQTWQKNLTPEQRQAGWVARLRTVSSWDEVPVNALKLSH
ncbi:MAG: glycogen debranching protein [Cyanobacteria bacterium P01_H01_bin.15]